MLDGAMTDSPTIEEYLRAAPSDEETARRAGEGYRELDTRARLAALADLLRDMDVILDGRMPAPSPDDETFWRHWMDPSLGRPD
jgi:hypothetical protein